jgi:general nucleoside transport system permease protein
MNWQGLLNVSFLVGLFASSIRLATPLLLSALGETITERSGVLNIGIEGLMIVGALAGFMGAYYSGSPWIGALCALVAGAGFACLHAYLSAILGADQVVSGLATNLLALGLAIFTFRAAFGIPANDPAAPTFEPIAIPLLANIPIIGAVFFNQHVWVYLSWLLVPVCYLLIFRTAWGLKVTAVGVNPLAAETAGIDVRATRFLAIVIGGALAGLGGMTLTLAQLGFFKEAMVSGRGFIAIAIVMSGRWNPVGVLVAAMLFGFADALQLRLQTVGMNVLIPPQLLVSLPYVLTILLLLTSARKSLMPPALSVPYTGSEKR